jgi:hypothetical protein
VQASAADEVQAIREAVHKAGLLGTRVYVDQGSLQRIHLADNLADAVVLGESVRLDDRLSGEALRVLRPGG